MSGPLFTNIQIGQLILEIVVEQTDKTVSTAKLMNE